MNLRYYTEFWHDVINEEIVAQSIAATSKQSYSNDVDNWANGEVVCRDEDTPMRIAKLLTQESFSTENKGKISNVSNKINCEVHTTVKNEACSIIVNNNHQANPTAPVDLDLNSKTSNGSGNQHDVTIEKQQVGKEKAIGPSTRSFVQSVNSSLQLDQKEPSNKTVGKIKDSKKQKKDPTFLEKPTAELTDFDTVMKRRKNKVDTMDNVSRFLGQFGHRDEKIGGHVLSKNWSKVKDAVQKRQYLHFKD